MSKVHTVPCALVFAAALIIIGLQVFFSSFLLSILGLRRRG